MSIYWRQSVSVLRIYAALNFGTTLSNRDVQSVWCLNAINIKYLRIMFDKDIDALMHNLVKDDLIKCNNVFKVYVFPILFF